MKEKYYITSGSLTSMLWYLNRIQRFLAYASVIDGTSCLRL